MLNQVLCNNLKRFIFGEVKRVLCYVTGSIDYGIWYSHVSNFRLCGLSDSDYVGSLDDRGSISAHIITLGSVVINWSSKKQATTTLPMYEAEYIAATLATCQAIWLRMMLAELQHEQESAIEIYYDNKVQLSMIKNPNFHSRRKHIDVSFHFICDLVAMEEIILKHFSTHEQLDDILTKLLEADRFIYLRALFGVCNLESKGNIEDWFKV